MDRASAPVPTIVLLLHRKQAAWFLHAPDHGWKLRQIKGEPVFDLSSAADLTAVLREIDDKVGEANHLAPFAVQVFSDGESAPLLEQLSPTLAKLQVSNWQVLRLEPLLAQAERHRPIPCHTLRDILPDSGKARAWRDEVLLPLIAERLWGEPAWPPAPVTPPNPDDGALQRRVRELEQRCAWLEAQRGSGPLPEGEALLSFLPALYPHVFSTLSGADLALLIGRVEPFEIPSPYAEPSTEVVRKKQREFLALPPEVQRALVQLVRSVAPQLKPRPEIAHHIERLLSEE